MKGLCIVLLLVFSIPSFAGYGGGEINRFYVSNDGWVYFGLMNQLPDTCSSWGEHFRFDGSTDSGKNMLSVLIAAKLAQKAITVWYTASPNPGTDQTNGCTGVELSLVSNIGIR